MSSTQMQKTYQDRIEEFKKVKQRICSILLDYPNGLTHAQLVMEYMTRFRHPAIIDNRLRELRSEGEAISFHREGCDVLLWRLSDRWSVRKKEEKQT